MRPVAVLVVACVVMISPTAVADYHPLTFSECVFDADVIVVGRIEALREKDYDLRVEEWIAGTKPAETLRIQRFTDWTCARREPAYASGQRVVSFLRPGDHGFFTMGEGCEGDVVLEGGVALMTTFPGGFGGLASRVPEGRFIEGVRTLRAGGRDAGDPQYEQGWRSLLAHSEPLVVATAIQRLGQRAARCSSEFADLIVDAIANPEPRVRLYAAGEVGEWLARADRSAVESRLTTAARTRPPELRPAAALGRLSLDPADPQRHGEVVALLADESVPLAERDALAIALDRWPSDIPEKLDLTRVDAAARDALPRIDDPSLLLHVCRYLDRLHRDRQFPRPDDAEAERARWLDRLDPGAPARRRWRIVGTITLVFIAGFAVLAFVLRSRRKRA